MGCSNVNGVKMRAPSASSAANSQIRVRLAALPLDATARRAAAVTKHHPRDWNVNNPTPSTTKMASAAAYDRPDLPLFAITNGYGDTQIGGALPTDAAAFTAAVAPIVTAAARGVWLRIPYDGQHVHLLPAAHALGFTLAHHVADGVLTLQAWRGGPANPTPHYAHTDIGAGAFVVNSTGQILVIREKFDGSGFLHIPGGHVDAGEDVVTAAAREAREETGVAAVALGVVAWRQLLLPVSPPAGTRLSGGADCERQIQNVRFGSSNLAAFVLCATGSNDLAPDYGEVSFAGWVDVGTAIAGVHEHEAVLLRAMVETGQVAAAAAVAAGMHSCHGGDAAVAVASAPASPTIPYLSSSYAVGTQHRRWEGCVYPAFLSSAYPPAVITAALEAAAGTRWVRRFGAGAGDWGEADTAAAATAALALATAAGRAGGDGDEAAAKTAGPAPGILPPVVCSAGPS